MNIYCNGDSFTAGEELLDHLFVGWPGYRTTGSIWVKDTDYRWLEVRKKIGISVFGSIEQFLKTQKEVSWAGQLNKIDKDISVINGSVGGASIIGIANRTIADLAKYKDKKFDLIFIQLTGPNRIEFYNSDLVENYFMKEHPIGHLEKFSEIQREIAKKYVESYSDKEFSIKYLYTMISLKYAIKGLTGKEPIFLLSQKVWKDYILDSLLNDNTLVDHEVIKTLINDSGILDISNDNIMETVQIKNNFLYTPLLHFEPRCHEEFAKVIYDKYIIRGNKC
jgi:hypothetical protein